MANPRRRTARVGARGAKPGVAPTLAPGVRSAKPSLRQRLRYRFDNTMSRGTPALVGWLAIVTVILVALFSASTLLAGRPPKHDNGARPGVIGQGFKTLLQALDRGAVAGDTGKWPSRLVR